MINSDSIMTTSSVVDQWARDNFTKLNRIFNGTFFRRSGQLVTKVSGLTAGGTPVVVYYERVGNLVSIVIPTVSSSSKVSTSSPSLAISLPVFLCPVNELHLATLVENNGANTVGYTYIGPTGNVTFNLANTGAWTAAAAAAIYATSFSYVGA